MKKLVNGIVTVASLLCGFSLVTAVVAYGDKAAPTVPYAELEEQELNITTPYNEEDMRSLMEEREGIKYSVNDYGQTYGTDYNVTYPENLPDLIGVIGDNGKQGYVYSDEFYCDPPSSPEEAVKITESMLDGTYEPKVFTVYAVDGKTAIDTFTESVPDNVVNIYDTDDVETAIDKVFTENSSNTMVNIY